MTSGDDRCEARLAGWDVFGREYVVTVAGSREPGTEGVWLTTEPNGSVCLDAAALDQLRLGLNAARAYAFPRGRERRSDTLLRVTKAPDRDRDGGASSAMRDGRVWFVLGCDSSVIHATAPHLATFSTGGRIRCLCGEFLALTPELPERFDSARHTFCGQCAALHGIFGRGRPAEITRRYPSWLVNMALDTMWSAGANITERSRSESDSPSPGERGSPVFGNPTGTR